MRQFATFFNHCAWLVLSSQKVLKNVLFYYSFLTCQFETLIKESDCNSIRVEMTKAFVCVSSTKNERKLVICRAQVVRARGRKVAGGVEF